MRLGTGTEDAFMAELAAEAGAARDAYGRLMGACTETTSAHVMLGDGTVRDEETFDPQRAQTALERTVVALEGWDSRDVSTTSNDDKRRLFTKFTVSEGDYVLSGHLSLQYHVLLYYVPDQRVMDCQKRLSEAIERAGAGEDRASAADTIVRRRLEHDGAAPKSEQEIFEALYNDEALRESIAGEIDSSAGPAAKSLEETKAELFAELDSYLLEAYSTSQVLIDEARLVGGEEGYVFSLDLERTGGGLDPESVPDAERKALVRRVRQLRGALDAAH